MLSLESDDIFKLQYKDQNGAVLLIKKYVIGHILSVQRLLYFLSCNGAAIYKDWSFISCDDFTSFQVSPLNSENPIPPVKQMVISGITIDHTYNTKTIINSSRYNDPIREFKRGIKRDPNLFTVLGRKTGWDNFNQALMIEAKAQDLYNIIDASYVPHDDEEKVLFFVKQSL